MLGKRHPSAFATLSDQASAPFVARPQHDKVNAMIHPSEPELRQLQRDQDAQRHAGLTRFARLLAERGTLRDDLTPERAADLIITLASFATYDSLVATRAS